MKASGTLCLTAATSIVVLSSLPAVAQEYGYPDACRRRPHHATYRCDADRGYGADRPVSGGYPYPVYADPYGPPAYGPSGGYAFRAPHHAFYGGYGYGYGGGGYAGY